MTAGAMLRWGSAVLLAVVALAWLVAGSLTDTRRNEMAADHLHRIEELQANISESVLKLRYGLINNYDGINQLVKQVRDSSEALSEGEASIVGRGNAAIDRQFAAWSAAFTEFQSRLELFKSRNAVLKNSIQHFAASAEAIRRHLPKDPRSEVIGDDLGTLQFVTVRYATSSDETLHNEVVGRGPEHARSDPQPAGRAAQGNRQYPGSR